MTISKNYILLIFVLLTSFLEAKEWNKELWTYLKYDAALKNDHRKIIKDHLKKYKNTTTKNEKIWYFMTESTLASTVGGLSAVGILSNAKDKIEPIIEQPESKEDYMVCAVLSYIYSKVPGWPIGFGSNKRSKKWLKKALTKSADPDVSFYIAQTYHNLGNDKLAKEYANISLAAFRKESGAYSKGKIQEIQNFSFLHTS